eukprot:912574-Pyramimonas_sp.AAC.1
MESPFMAPPAAMAMMGVSIGRGLNASVPGSTVAAANENVPERAWTPKTVGANPARAKHKP